MPTRDPNRRHFLGQLGGMSAMAAFGGAKVSPSPIHATASPEWDLSWIARVQKAKHRAVFDAPSPGVVLDLAARYIANVRTVYGNDPGDICAVLNIRTRAVSMALNDSIWQKYALGEDAKVNDPATGAPTRRNLDLHTPDSEVAQGRGSLQSLGKDGAIILVCDFALGHLAGRLAPKANAEKEPVLAEMRASLVPGAVLVPSGIFGAAQAQNAGCAFIPA